MAIKTVIDTNIIVSALSSRSQYHWLIEALFDERFEMYITNEILLEYEEVLTRKYSSSIASGFITALKELPNVKFTHIFFRWDLLGDKDDNKFVDCYVAAGAEYLVTQDTDFSVLRRIPFPQIEVIGISAFQTTILY
jgi:uncharacterized protein